ncbi:MAG: methyltransferase domain-containing protein [Eubacteriales bacterium]|nr:methyltransferase domain-containing protein [Eubacteriales bacterium]MDD3882022.1 methyltransferase domain-containing protein [Eubacteriales bacterium]MDD4512469.1 methyltransferase domain-containing protein [Eubacteriales bacterium]
MPEVLKKYDMRGKTIGQFCCNNGRELLSLVRTTGAKGGIGFDIAENMVAFANGKAKELPIPCRFIAENILDIGSEYDDTFDFVILTIGALCWFKSLNDYFKVVCRTLKKGGVIIVNEQHPLSNMLAAESDEGYDANHPLDLKFSYFEHEWVGNDGMGYITGKSYKSKTFTDYTHSLSEIISSMCKNGVVITDMKEFDYDISGNFDNLSGQGIPLSLILEGRKD